MSLKARVDKDGNLLPDIQGRPNPNIFNTIPYYPGVKEPNIFQDAKRRGLAGIIGGTLDNLTMGMTDFDKRGDSKGQKTTKDFLKSFIFGTKKAKGPAPVTGSQPVPMPEIASLPDSEGTPVPMPNPSDFPDREGTPVPMPDPSEKTTTQKVEEFLDPTGKQAEKRLDPINIGGKDYKLYTDKNTGKEFIPFDPRISGNKGDFDRYGQPLTEEEKKLIQQGARIGSFRPNPYTEEQMREIGRENLIAPFQN